MKINKFAHKAQRGFTLIELMVSIMILGILVAIALPNFVGAMNQAKVANVKVNMNVMQTVVETYASDWDGFYPSDVFGLRYEATQIGKDYWHEVVNPITGQTGSGLAYDDASRFTFTQTGVTTPDAADAGLVLYDNTSPDHVQYFIYGLDKSGNTIQDRGQNFTLSNS